MHEPCRHPCEPTVSKPSISHSARIASPPPVSSACRRALALLALTGLPALQPALAAPSPPAPSPSLTLCSATALAGHAPDADEVAAHRKTQLPGIHYPFGRVPPGGSWGLLLTLKVNESGQVVCYQAKDQYGKDQPLNDQRRAVLEQIKDWRYTPFTRDQHPVAAVLVEHILEDELPQTHVAVPEGPLETVHLRLDRGMCLGVCPVYTVDLDGDGQVVYRGSDFVDVSGEHHYSVPAEGVARLVQKLRASELWSLRPQYVSRITDAPRYILTIRIGPNQRQVVDYVGESVGMPVAVTDFENELDRVTGTEMWITLTRPGLEHLKKEGFNFQSKEGGDVLARAVTGGREEAVLLELLKLGAPITSSLDPDQRLRNESSISVLDMALLNGQPALADALISRGALQSGAKPDTHKLNVAFRAAIAGGRLALVQKIWDAGGGIRPSLTYLDSPEPGRVPGRPTPVSLLLSPERSEGHPWEGLGIVKWLEAQGCDIKAATADGITLLHVAVTAPDIELTRYLLTQGIKDNPIASGTSVLQSAQNEETALLLLTSGTSAPPAGEAGRQYRAYIDTQHWSRVAAWLKGHGG
jgi:ankyrin repeat protein